MQLAAARHVPQLTDLLKSHPLINTVPWSPPSRTLRISYTGTLVSVQPGTAPERTQFINKDQLYCCDKLHANTLNTSREMFNVLTVYPITTNAVSHRTGADQTLFGSPLPDARAAT